MANHTITELFHNCLHLPRVEPVQRMVGGRFGWAIHRFPIKGGISIARIMALNVTKNNALFRRLNDGS